MQRRVNGVFAKQEKIAKLKQAMKDIKNSEGMSWQIADVAAAAEVSESTVKRFYDENRKERIKEINAKKICQVLHLNPEEIIDYRERERENKNRQLARNPTNINNTESDSNTRSENRRNQSGDAILNSANLWVYICRNSCHNSEDRHEIDKIAEKLRKQKMNLWQGETCPGEDFELELQRCIQQVDAAVVFIGSSGLSPWQNNQENQILERLDQKGYRIVTVLLPTAPQDLSFSHSNLSLPRYLTTRGEWVDFRKDDPDPMEQLLWGITGEKPSRGRKFMTIYSYNEKDKRADKSPVVTVLPAYMLEKGATQYTSEEKQAAAENLSHSNTPASIKNDVRADRIIASSFTKNFLPIPDLIWDETEINFNDGEEKTYIFMGLSNHQLSRFKNVLTPEGKYFSIEIKPEKTVEQETFNSFILKCGCFDDFNNFYPDMYPSQENDMFDYALFAKFSYNNKKIIVCGGVTETSTYKAALYVSENLENIYDRLEYEKGSDLDPDDSFTIIIGFPKGEQSTKITIERVCIKNSLSN